MSDRPPANLLPTRGERAAAFLPVQDGPARLASVVWSTGCRVLWGGGEAHTLCLEPGAADLSRLNGGRAPLLIQHGWHIADLVGRVEESWIEDGHGHAIVRFAARPAAEELYSLLLDGMPLNASLGYAALEAEPAPDYRHEAPHFLIRRWRAREVSIVLEGADEGARFVTPVSLGELAALQEKKRRERLSRELIEYRAGLQPDRWRAWAAHTGAEALAAELGLPPDRVAGPLDRLVAAHLAELAAG